MNASSDERAGATGSVVLSISGMHCDSCIALIEEVLSDHAGVRAASVDLASAAARVSFDPAAVTIDELCSAIVELGYGVAAGGQPTEG